MSKSLPLWQVPASTMRPSGSKGHCTGAIVVVWANRGRHFAAGAERGVECSVVEQAGHAKLLLPATTQ